MTVQQNYDDLSALRQLMDICLRSTFKARDCGSKVEQFQSNCLQLFGKDYKYLTVDNVNGELCNHYPTKIVLLEYSKTPGEKHDYESLHDATKLKELFFKARLARCRSRFTVPVILYNGKHICRGATLSGGAEMYGRSSFEFFTTGGVAEPNQPPPVNANSGGEWQLFDKVRGHDIRLLKELNVTAICDLMVEKKKVKFGLNVTSSEKVDKERRYADFQICGVPYPGCEFFKVWRENNFDADSVTYDWSQGFVDAVLELPESFLLPSSIDWSKYMLWDLTTLTKNYLKLFLNYIEHGDSGLLIHCISGWDRTPLFISLIRLSLWADMKIHESLGPADILYLTIAYDWFLFGHNFPDRLAKGEDIFFFCFNFLSEMTTEDFVFKKKKLKRKENRPVNRIDSEFTLEGVLLEACGEAGEHGSNTSINSESSLNSTRSSTDNAPIFFNVPAPHEEEHQPSGDPLLSLHANNQSTACQNTNTPLLHDNIIPSNQNLLLDNQTSNASGQSHAINAQRQSNLSHTKSVNSYEPAVLYMHNIPESSNVDLSNQRAVFSNDEEQFSGNQPTQANFHPQHTSAFGTATSGLTGYGATTSVSGCPGNGIVNQGNGTVAQGNGTLTQGNGVTGNGYGAEQKALRSHLMYTSTSPKAVPVPRTSARMLSDARPASVSGSWQLISSSGSLRGSAASYECSSSGSHSDQSSRGPSSSKHKRKKGGHDQPEQDTARKQRLEAVRRIFLSIYTTQDLRSPTNAGNMGGFSGLVGNFAEKLGIKQPARSTVL